MLLLTLERASARTEGYVDNYLLRYDVHGWVGHLPSRVRQALWLRVQRDEPNAAGTLWYGVTGGQGFQVLTFGAPRRAPSLVDGLWLMPTRAPVRQPVQMLAHGLE